MYRQSYRDRGNSPYRSNNQFKSRFSRGKRQNTQKINEARFIKKAVQAAPVVQPISSVKFADLSINPVLKTNIVKHGYENLTAVQEGAIQPIIEGKDVIGLANTGTGKTGAFLIPLIDRTLREAATKTLIIVPTRELAAQIHHELQIFSQSMRIYCAICIGGANIRNQIYELRRSPQFIIGTPGRLKDLIERKTLNLSNFNTVVLDEVDRMLDMGFIADIKYIFTLLPPKRQSLFFSATIAGEINTLIQSFMNNPVRVSVKTQDTAENVDQDIVRVQNGAQKVDILTDMLKREEFKKVLIFGRTKFGVERLSTTLYQRGFKVSSIHGDKPQFKRSQAIRLFKENVVQILVATDVAARGIDISDITHVINYDQPATYEDYVHRIGRTGRANKKGIALTFVD